MTGLRAAQKARRRGAMLASAAKLFERQGYEGTTFDEIAAGAGVGVATVYKYFGSKQGIVIALLQPSLVETLAGARKVIERTHTDAGEAMVQLLSSYRNLGGRNWASRELLRNGVFPGIGNEGELAELVRQSDFDTEAQIRSLLERLRRAGLLKPRLSLHDAAAVIFALLNQHFAAYLSDRNLSFGDVFRRLTRRVRLVFEDWRD